MNLIYSSNGVFVVLGNIVFTELAKKFRTLNYRLWSKKIMASIVVLINIFLVKGIKIFKRANESDKIGFPS